MIQARWEHFPHQADMGVRGIGNSREEAFEQAALAVAALATDPASVKPKDEIAITCEAPDDEMLLVDFLNAVIFEMSARKMALGRFEVHLNGQRLSAKAWGEGLERDRHPPGVEVKGATYTALAVRRSEDGTWMGQCVVDV